MSDCPIGNAWNFAVLCVVTIQESNLIFLLPCQESDENIKPNSLQQSEDDNLPKQSFFKFVFDVSLPPS